MDVTSSPLTYCLPGQYPTIHTYIHTSIHANTQDTSTLHQCLEPIILPPLQPQKQRNLPQMIDPKEPLALTCRIRRHHPRQPERARLDRRARVGCQCGFGFWAGGLDRYIEPWLNAARYYRSTGCMEYAVLTFSIISRAPSRPSTGSRTDSRPWVSELENGLVSPAAQSAANRADSAGSSLVGCDVWMAVRARWACVISHHITVLG